MSPKSPRHWSLGVSPVAALLLVGGLVLWLAWRRLAPVPERTPASSPELLLFCGAGLQPLADALIKEFSARTGVRVAVTYAGSGQLLGQLKALPRGDLFLPGAEFYIQRAVALGLADPTSRQVLAQFVPVLLVAKGNPLHVNSLADLTRPGLRVGLGDERACAVGQAAQQILTRSGMATAAAANVVLRTATVNELGVAVQMGTVDATIVWDATARQFDAAGTVVAIPAGQNAPAEVAIVRLRTVAERQSADGFIAFATSAEGRERIRGAGYAVAGD